MLRLALFVVASAGIVWLSWPSLGNRRSHGFFRSFAFEAILALILVNVVYWFREPFSLLHILSWALLAGSLFLVVHGFHLLRVIGRPQGEFENTTRLVTLGAYRYIRHPLYSSLLLLAWGAFFKQVSPVSALLALAASACLAATARVEEAENLAKFGEAYAAYRQRTRMFIPFLI